ncbi:MAG: HEPN domain-containing protein [Candidatus Zixiibacteriota bacterium]|jgi:HEPN domain-containing protein
MGGNSLLIYRRWLLQGNRDLKAAEVLHKIGAHEWAAFLAKQAAERVLKAYLYYNGEDAVVDHSIRSLLHKCNPYSPAFEEIHDVGKMDQFYAGPRFPDSFDEAVPADAVTPDQAAMAVELARKAVALVDSLPVGND